MLLQPTQRRTSCARPRRTQEMRLERAHTHTCTHPHCEEVRMCEYRCVQTKLLPLTLAMARERRCAAQHFTLPDTSSLYRLTIGTFSNVFLSCVGIQKKRNKEGIVKKKRKNEYFFLYLCLSVLLSLLHAEIHPYSLSSIPVAFLFSLSSSSIRNKRARPPRRYESVMRALFQSNSRGNRLWRFYARRSFCRSEQFSWFFLFECSALSAFFSRILEKK